MLNAAYGAIKSVRRDNLVIGAGTAPYGDPRPGGRRVMEVRFLRALLCLSGRSLRALPCRRPARLDAIAHHPYRVREPRSRALNADDAAVPDVHKLTRVARAAVRKRTVLPRRRKRVSVTEVSWDSRPPDPDGVAAQTHARWLEDSVFQLWRQGVEAVTWFGLRDQPPLPSYGATYKSGVLLAGERQAGGAGLPLPLRHEPVARRRYGVGPLARGRHGLDRAAAGRRLAPAARTPCVAGRGLTRAPEGRPRGPFRARSGAEQSLAWRFR